MTQVTTDTRRLWWQIAVPHVEFLQEEGFSSNAGFYADRFAKMTGKATVFREEFREEWDGTHYDAFQEVEDRRRSYHEDERSLQLRRLWQHMLALAEGERAAQLTLSDVENPIARQMLCKAVHDTTDWQYQKPGEVADESDVELRVYCLGSGEIDELSRRALEAARHGIALEVLDTVSHYLDGHDVYEATPKTVLSSPAAIADAVQAEHSDKPRPKRIDIAMEEYQLDPDYDGKTDERSIRKALHAAFKRRE